MNVGNVISIIAASTNPNVIPTGSDLFIELPSGSLVPYHFHVTEVGLVNKVFVDCGGAKREMVYCAIQVWVADDVDHRLSREKFIDLMTKSEKILKEHLPDNTLFVNLPVMIEYGSDVAAQYFLSNVTITPKGPLLTLVGKETDCLAPDKCGVSGCCDC